jgi:hypothetical protein
MFRFRPAHNVRAYRPCVEILETRTLLSTYVVDRLTDTGAGSGLAGDLFYCLEHAADGDAVTFGVTGTISSRGFGIAHNISIEGPGPGLLTVDGPGSIPLGPVFYVTGGAMASISGLTISHGYYQGGGIHNEGTLAVSNCVISDNIGDDEGSELFLAAGGGLFNSGVLTVSNCTISHNHGGPTGGGIANYGMLTLSNSTVADNLATYDQGANGGGIDNEGTLAVVNSIVSNNYAYNGDGGGIANALRVASATLMVSNSTVSGNSAGGGGGISNSGTLTLSNSTVSGNSALGGFGSGLGGGILTASTVSITNVTLTANRAGVHGGGLYVSPGSPVLHNTLVAGNFRGTTRDDVYGALNSGGDYNLIGDGTGMTGLSDGVNGNLVGSAAAPVDPLLGPLQDNGGPTQTHALLAGSPALNAGDPAQLGVADQRGVVRSGGVNIGAYQASASAFVLTAPDSVTVGAPFDLTVQAVDPFGQTAVGYTGTVHFNSSDGQAVLPSDYAFTSDDAGLHTFSGGVTLKTAGNQSVTATDTSTGSITASATVSVNPAAADHLLFLQQPTDTAAGQTLGPVMVEVVDAFGNVETSDNSDTIRLSIGTNPSGGTLGGTLSLTVVNGVATFSDLTIDLAGAAYTLHATADGGLPGLDSDPFNVT